MYVRDLRAPDRRRWVCACTRGARGEKDDRLRSAPLLVADAVLIIMLIEISTAAKIDSPSGFHARIANASQCDLVFSIVHTSCEGVGREG